MSRDNYTIQPMAHRAIDLARQQGWSLAKAEYVLDGYCRVGWAKKLDDGQYIITSAGLAIGEQAGIVKPFDPVHGYGDGEGKLLSPPAKK